MQLTDGSQNTTDEEICNHYEKKKRGEIVETTSFMTRMKRVLAKRWILRNPV